MAIVDHPKREKTRQYDANRASERSIIELEDNFFGIHDRIRYY